MPTIILLNSGRHLSVNKEELFNLYCVSAQNVIKHIFGVLKHHFWILLLLPEYNITIQAIIPVALSAIHNFILLHNTDPDMERSFQCLLDTMHQSGDGLQGAVGQGHADEGKSRGVHDEDEGKDKGEEDEDEEAAGEYYVSNETMPDNIEGSAQYDHIAKDMWDDYQ
ncbi:hypothetical protein ID866_11765 [Astraeus odoratus]|nr:hypothetical protein ID866_11765 [Astraeus odoratus]